MRIAFKISAIVFGFFVLTLAFAPYQPSRIALGTFASPAISLNNSSITTFWGFSPYDAYDRIMNVYYHASYLPSEGIEVARIITPLHRDGALPDSFKWTLQFPFIVHNDDSFTHYTYNTQNTWSLVASTSYRGLGTSYVEALIKVDNAGWSVLSIPQQFDFTTSSDNERIFVLVSGHIRLELRSDIHISIDALNYTVPNWHPIDNDAQLTSTGYVIPYLGGPDGIVLPKAGHHTLVILPQPQIAGSSYLLISAFGVIYDQQKIATLITSTTTTTSSTTYIPCRTPECYGGF